MNKKSNGSKTEETVPSKAERIISAVRRKDGETAAEIVERTTPKVDQNHVYIFQSLVTEKILKRVGKRGRGCTYVKGGNLPK